MKSACHVYYFVNGHKTHSNIGCITHNTAGFLTHYTSYVSFIQRSYCSLPCCISSLPVGVFSKQHCNAGTSYPHNLFEKIGNNTTVCKQQYLKPVAIAVYILLYKCNLNPPFCYKPYKHYKRTVLPLVLAINQSIYYLLNGTFLNRAYDTNHLICRLLLKLQQYITRHGVYKHNWISLLLSGLLSSQQISLWFLTIIFWRIRIIAYKIAWFQNLNFTVNQTNNIIAILLSSLHYMSFRICINFISLCSPSNLTSNLNIKTNWFLWWWQIS